MLSKEEIEKAKERIQEKLNNILFGTLYSQEENNEDEKTLLQYIDQLEQENKELLEIKDMKESIELANMNIKSLLKFKYENEKLKNKIAQLEKSDKSKEESNMNYYNKCKELEQENKKQNEESYWKGYIQKQNEAMEICKICKYKKQYFEKKVEEEKC